MKKINRVIFFLTTKFSYRDYKRFGFDIIQQRGYKVEAWDFTAWYKPEYAKNYDLPDPIEFSGHKIFNTLSETKASIINLKGSDIVLDPWNTNLILNLEKLKAFKIGSISSGLIPNPRIDKRTQYIDYLYLIIFRPIQAFIKIKNKIINNIIKDFHLDFLITGGKGSRYNERNKIDNNTKIIKAHTLDYDLYIEEEMNGNKKDFHFNEPFAVFLDEDIVFHPDYSHLGIKPYCTADRYYPAINNFFTKFEEKTGLKIIIAAHPRADYVKRGNPFDNRELVVGKTISLVKESQIVLAHMSTSINFAVLYYKPIILIDSKEYRTLLTAHVKAWSSALGLKIINVSKELTINTNEINIDKEKYNEYKEHYIKESNTPKKYIWDIFCNYLDDLNQKSN